MKLILSYLVPLIGQISLILTFSSVVLAKNSPEGMVLIKAGCFTMGTDKSYFYPDQEGENTREHPAHKVCLDAFYMDTHEATQKQWEGLMGGNPSVFIGENLPVEHISWEDANKFCKKRGRRLPTEAEWEYASLAGSNKENFWGDEIDGDFAWYATNSVRKPNPVGTRKPNAWGLYDTMGSVWEWVSDWYDQNYYKRSPEKNPQGPKSRQSWRIIKGGSWLDDESYFRAAIRHRGNADRTETFLVGVRCAKSVE